MTLTEGVVVAIITGFCAMIVAIFNNNTNVSKKEFDNYQSRRTEEMRALERKIDALNELTSAVVKLTEQSTTLFKSNEQLKLDIEKVGDKLDKLNEKVIINN